MAFKVPEKNRVRAGRMASDETAGNNGAFLFQADYAKLARSPEFLFVIASDGMGWEHVSVSLQGRTPTWAEMCRIKDEFWGPEDVVLQFHPARSQYVNFATNCLHLWRAIDTRGNPLEQRVPPTYMVGPKS